MSNIQEYNASFAVTFPIDAADQLLARMQQLYGADFNRKFGDIEPAALAQTVCVALNGITPKQIERGLDRMLSEKWCPSLPEFRNMCMPTWWTAEQAWAKALQFEADPQVRITKLTKVTLDEVRHILDNEGQKAAHRAFKDIYTAYLTKALEKGRDQEMWVAPEPVKQLAYVEPKGVPCPPELLAKLGKIGKRVGGVV